MHGKLYMAKCNSLAPWNWACLNSLNGCFMVYFENLCIPRSESIKSPLECIVPSLLNPLPRANRKFLYMKQLGRMPRKGGETSYVFLKAGTKY